MKNYIGINGMKIELTEEQVKQIIASYNQKSAKLEDFSVEEIVRIGDHEMIVMEHLEDGSTVLLRKDAFLDDVVFGKNNNYDGSNMDDICNKFADEIAAIVGKENIITYTLDLTTDDGLKDYGTIRRRASSLTATMCRKYVDILDKFKLNRWWWLATAHSTKKHENDQWVKCVSPSGCIYDNSCNYFGYGVRPFCILKSTIFVSC